MIILKHGTRVMLTSGNTKLGVAEDVNAKLLQFKFPRYPEGNAVDLADGVIYIAFVNSKGDTYEAIASNVVADNTTVSFEWLIEKAATLFGGQIKFQVQLRKTVNSEVVVKWQTEIAIGQFAQTINTEHPSEIPEVEMDIITELLESVRETTSNAIETIGVKTGESLDAISNWTDESQMTLARYETSMEHKLDDYTFRKEDELGSHTVSLMNLLNDHERANEGELDAHTEVLKSGLKQYADTQQDALKSTVNEAKGYATQSANSARQSMEYMTASSGHATSASSSAYRAQNSAANAANSAEEAKKAAEEAKETGGVSPEDRAKWGAKLDVNDERDINFEAFKTNNEKMSIAEGYNSSATGNVSHAEGHTSSATGDFSHAEGYKSVAEGEASHAEGNNTSALARRSHSEGHYTVAEGASSHVEGQRAKSTSTAPMAHAEGNFTIANGRAQHVEGQYNAVDETPADTKYGANANKYIHVVGNGTSETDRSNAHTLDWDGNAWYAGSVTINGDTEITKEDVDRWNSGGSNPLPNVVIIGSPTIQHGQVSGFSISNYLQFPFVLDLKGRHFELAFSFTTGSDVTAQQNVIDSYFGIAVAVLNRRGVMSISSNGTSWDIGSATGTVVIQPNTTYYAKLSWDGTQYKTALSTDGQSYTDDMVINSSLTPFPQTILIGGGNLFGGHPFKGTIDLNDSHLLVEGVEVWSGMDMAGIATRANVSLSNLDEEGEAKLKPTEESITKALGYTPADKEQSDILWQMAEGSVYTKQSQTESGIAVPPEGARFGSLESVEGLTTQDGEPSPQYPQEIKSIESFTVTRTGKNLISDGNTYSPKYIRNTTISTGGLTITVDADGVITATGTPVITEPDRAVFTLWGSDVRGTMKVGHKYYGSGYVSSRYVRSGVVNYGLPIITEDITEVIPYIQVLVKDYVSGMKVYPMLCDTELSKEFEPYHGTSRTITPPRPLNKIGDYADVVDIKDGQYVYNIGSVDLGTLAWANPIATAPTYRASLADFPLQIYGEIPNLLTGRYRRVATKSNNQSIADSGDYLITCHSSFKGVFINDSRFDNAEAFKNSLEGQELLYVSSTEQTAPISPEDLTFLLSLRNIPSTDVLTVVDNHGRDVSYIMDYLLEHRTDLSEYVKNTDYATSAKAGVAKFNPNYGGGINNNGVFYTEKATASEIDARTHNYKPIAPSNLNYAVTAALTDSNHIQLSETQAQTAREVLGAHGGTAKLVATHVTTGNDTVIYIDLSNGGKGYRYIAVVAMAKDGNTYWHSSVNPLVCINTNIFIYGKCVGVFNRQAKHLSFSVDARAGIIVCSGINADGNNDNRTTVYSDSSIKSLFITVRGDTTPISAGCTFDVYGIE